MSKFSPPITLRIFAILAMTVASASALDPIFVYYGAGRQLAMGHLLKADGYLQKNQIDQAIREANEALRIDANFWPAFFVRAEALLNQQKWDAVIQDCNAGLKMEPTFIEFAVLRARANSALGRSGAALAELDHVVRLHPPRTNALAMTLNTRAWLLATCADASLRNPQRAITDARQACNLTRWSDGSFIDTLAIACAAAGDFDSALRYEEQAMKASSSSAALREHLALIKQHRPVRAK